MGWVRRDVMEWDQMGQGGMGWEWSGEPSDGSVAQQEVQRVEQGCS